MKLYKNLDEIKKIEKPSSITIGNFDGMHIGHLELLDSTIENRKLCDKESNVVAITFNPMPQEFFKKNGFFRIMNDREKIEIFTEKQFDYVVSLPFDERFSLMSPEDFIEKVLIDKLNICHLTIGENFRFGHKRRGDINLLKKYSNSNFDLSVVPLIKKFSDQEGNQQIVNSTLIRELIVSNDFKRANSLLRNKTSITGKVIHGEKRGRKLGYPTANINVCEFWPINGIFLVEVDINGFDQKYGLASYGNKPTFSGRENTLEVFIFDHNQEIYGKEIKIVFLEKIRDQVKFTSEQELIKQMDNDYQKALKILKNNDRL